MGHPRGGEGLGHLNQSRPLGEHPAWQEERPAEPDGGLRRRPASGAILPVGGGRVGGVGADYFSSSRQRLG